MSRIFFWNSSTWMEGESIKHYRLAADAQWMNHTIDVEIVWEAPFFVNPVSSKVILPIHSITLRYVFFFIIYHWTSWSLILKCWNGKFFEHNTLKNLGGRIQLGHAIGKPCPLPIPAFGDSFNIININGIHDIRLDFCGCGRHATMTQQLLRFRLYPATAQNPNTAATIHTLHHFQLLSFESKCLVYEFHQTLVHESDYTSHRKVKVCKLV